MTLGLKRKQVKRAVSTFPLLLNYSIEEILQPKVQWLMTLGLSKDDFVQAVSIFHQLLGIGYSIEENLDPKEPWLKTLGLPRDQAAKVVSTFSRFRAKTIVR